jgi:hypothetical protein
MTLRKFYIIEFDPPINGVYYYQISGKVYVFPLKEGADMMLAQYRSAYAGRAGQRFKLTTLLEMPDDSDSV